MTVAAVAYSADIQTDAVLSTNLAAPSQVAIGSNGFVIKVWATGNINNANATGQAKVVTKYFMATNGSITPCERGGSNHSSVHDRGQLQPESSVWCDAGHVDPGLSEQPVRRQRDPGRGVRHRRQHDWDFDGCNDWQHRSERRR